MATKMGNRVGVNFAIFRSNPWSQFIVVLEICCKATNIHEHVETKICMLLIPINGNEDGKSGWCKFCYFSQ